MVARSIQPNESPPPPLPSSLHARPSLLLSSPLPFRCFLFLFVFRSSPNSQQHHPSHYSPSKSPPVTRNHRLSAPRPRRAAAANFVQPSSDPAVAGRRRTRLPPAAWA